MGGNVNRGKNSAFSLEQSSDRKAILRNLLKSTILSLEGVLADAAENIFVRDHGDASVYRTR